MTKRRLFILGAGASYAAGLPDADHVLGHLFAYAFQPFVEVLNRTPQKIFSPLQPLFLEAMRIVLGEGTHKRFPLDSICGLIHQWAYEDVANRFHLLELMYQAICEAIYYFSWGGYPTYKDFVQALREGDCVITFNWDVCLELALYDAARDFSRSFKPGDARHTLLVLKPHGSVDYLLLERDQGNTSREVWVAGEQLTENLGAVYSAIWSGAITRHEVHRLRTYDLPVNATVNWDFERRNVEINVTKTGADFVPMARDLTAFSLMRPLQRNHFLLTPGLSDKLYDLAYRWLEDALAPGEAMFEKIVVCGYSFPPYDAGAVKTLGRIARLLGHPPTHIVNPSAASLPRVVLDETFGKVELHECGFEQYDWGA